MQHYTEILFQILTGAPPVSLCIYLENRKYSDHLSELESFWPIAAVYTIESPILVFYPWSGRYDRLVLMF